MKLMTILVLGLLFIECSTSQESSNENDHVNGTGLVVLNLDGSDHQLILEEEGE